MECSLWDSELDKILLGSESDSDSDTEFFKCAGLLRVIIILNQNRQLKPLFVDPDTNSLSVVLLSMM